MRMKSFCVLLAAVFLLSASAASNRAAEPTLPLKAGIIGMDAHALPWTKIVNNPEAAGELADMTIVAGYPGGSPDIPQSMEILERSVKPCSDMGVEIVDSIDELLWQIRNFTRFFWVSGGLFAEMNIHQIDEICWLKGDYPATAQGIGGRMANSTNRGQGFDSISIEWTFPDGTKAYDGVRWLGGHCFKEFATFAHGTKCAAQFSGNIHKGTTRLYKDQRIQDDNLAWEAPPEKYNPWDAEWNVLLSSIRNDTPQNEAKRAAMSNFADLMGRAAVHSGKIITWDEMYNSKFQFVENIDDMDYDTEPPVKVGPDGYYPVPIPGKWMET